MKKAQYDTEWHVEHRERNIYSAERVAEIVMSMLTVRTVVDFGCGDGVWLRAFRQRGVQRILGYDGPWTDPDLLQIDSSDFQIKDLSAPVRSQQDFDLAICLEVAEHLPESVSTTLIESICSHAPVVLFGAAIPNQGGYRHINEQWQSSWATKFRSQGYKRFDFIRAEIWDEPDIQPWYKQNIAVFVRHARIDILAPLRAKINRSGMCSMPANLVHPDIFEAISNYEQIAFKPLSRRIIPATVHKIRTIVLDVRRQMIWDRRA